MFMSSNSEALLQRQQANKRKSSINVGEIERLASAMAGGALAFYGLRAAYARRTMPDARRDGFASSWSNRSL